VVKVDVLVLLLAVDVVDDVVVFVLMLCCRSWQVDLLGACI
jgi:hypothetical protein